MLFTLLLRALLAHQSLLLLCLAAPTDPEFYLAPLHGETSSNAAPKIYIVMFMQDGPYDTDIDQHWQTIGMNLSSSEQFHHLSVSLGYTARIEESPLISQVRNSMLSVHVIISGVCDMATKWLQLRLRHAHFPLLRPPNIVVLAILLSPNLLFP